MKKQYFYQYSEIKDLSVQDLINRIEANRGKKISELTISEMIFHENKPIHTGCGVYLFLSEGEIFYVGKNSARCFVERIPSHFDIRKEGWFNRLLRIIAKKEKEGSEKTDEGLQKAAIHAIKNFEVVMINFEWQDYENDTSIEVLENLLRMSTNAANSFKTKRNKNLDVKIAEFVDARKAKKKSRKK